MAVAASKSNCRFVTARVIRAPILRISQVTKLNSGFSVTTDSHGDILSGQIYRTRQLKCAIFFKKIILIQLLFRFAKGVSCLRFLDEVRRHEALLRVLLVDQNVALDALTRELTFQVTLSEEGSNRRRHELHTQTHWRDLVQDLEG